MTPRPRWRWWLHWNTHWGWVDSLLTWSVLPEWLGWDGKPFEHGEDPW